MPSFADSIVIFVIALVLFGPKKLPQLARQLGKLMGEFRRASNDFRMQMEEEMRIVEQEENQRKIDASATSTISYPDPDHPHLSTDTADTIEPIAESGDLKMMPPSSGLPEGRPRASSNAGVIAVEDPPLVIEPNVNYNAEPHGEPDQLNG